ncbi:MAG: hypothetical protein RBS37_07275, partial [Bacteroidales bacterium]|nr:hypothetical protein [Bacteroidales bacterium]
MNKLFLSSCILLAFLGLSISAQTSKNAMEIGVTSDLLLSVNRFKTDIPELSESKEDELHWDNQFGDLYFNGPVYALAVCGTDLYIGGNFTSLNENPASYLAKWDGKTFTAL